MAKGRVKKWLIRLSIAGVAAAIILFPSWGPVSVTARSIDLGKDSSIYAVAYIEQGAPYLPAALFGSGWGDPVEFFVAEGINFRDSYMVDARNQAWVIATFIDSGITPETWVDLGPEGTVSNVIACPQGHAEEPFGCVSEKPYPAPRGLTALLNALKGKSPSAGVSNSPESSPLQPRPVQLAEHYGYPVEPAAPGSWTPVLDEKFPSPPGQGELGMWMGASVGLAYSLAYLDYLGGPLVPDGMRVAASGSVSTSPSGTSLVGPVIGLQQKAEGAVRAGVNVFFVPQGQAEDISDVDGLTVVEVSTPFEALKWLCEQGSESPYCSKLYSKKTDSAETR